MVKAEFAGAAASGFMRQVAVFPHMGSCLSRLFLFREKINVIVRVLYR
jgi:hypothetical protein